MKIALRIFAFLCLLWALLPLVLNSSKRPLVKSNSAIYDVERILEQSGEPHFRDDKHLAVSRRTLIDLTEQAKSKDYNFAQKRRNDLLWISSGFAFIAAVSLFLLSYRKRNEIVTPT